MIKSELVQRLICAEALVDVQRMRTGNLTDQDWQRLTAAAFISTALPLVVFLSLQRYFVRGILAGSVKG